VAERHEIAARYSEWEIIGPAEIRNIDPSARYFTPWKIVPHADLIRIEEPPPELQPHLRSRQRLTNKRRSWRGCSFAGMSPTAPGHGATRRCKTQRTCTVSLPRRSPDAERAATQ